jgi:hypothetical protein
MSLSVVRIQLLLSVPRIPLWRQMGQPGLHRSPEILYDAIVGSWGQRNHGGVSVRKGWQIVLLL